MTFASLLPELALGFLALFAAYLLGARSERRKARKREFERLFDEGCHRLMRDIFAAPDLRDENRAEREALAELCAILGPREVPE